MKCTSCDTDNPHGTEFCEVCGNPLPTARRRTVLAPGGPTPTPAAPPDPARKGRTLYDPSPQAPAPSSTQDVFANPTPRPRYDPQDPFKSSIVPKSRPVPKPEPAAPAPTPAPPRHRTVLERPAAPAQDVRGCLYLPSTGAFVPLSPGRTSMGRDPDNDVVVDDPKVSGTHGFLYLKDTGAHFLDASRNGSIVDGDAVLGEPHPLRHGSIITLGATKCAVLLLPSETLAAISEGTS